VRLILLVGAGGFLGAVARYLVGGWVQRLLPAAFPYGTLAVNVVGSLLLGAVYELGTARGALDPQLRLMLGVGVLGAFTTFSTFSLETLNLLREGSVFMAGTNVLTNVLVCLAAVWLGVTLVRVMG
jgi:CrcB protein